MRVGLQTWGSDGDIRPFLALGARLRSAGHEPTLWVTSVDGKEYASAGRLFRFRVIDTPRPEIGPDQLQAFRSEIVRTRDVTRHLKLVIRDLIEPSTEIVRTAAEAVCAEHELVVGHSMLHELASEAIRKNRIHVSVQFTAGLIPSRHVPPPEFPNLGALGNRTLWWLGRKVMDQALLGRVNANRRRLGVPRAKTYMGETSQSRTLNLIAVSPLLCPPQPDWAAHDKVCGAFVLPGEQDAIAMPVGLEAFLSAGPPPVFLGFGSMMQLEANVTATTRILVSAVERVGCRAVIQSEWDRVTDIPESPGIFRIRSAPHARVFRRCAAVVHHGGAGTSHAVAHAGVPSVVVPYYLDQGYWADVLHQARVAPKGLFRRALTVDRLTAKLREALDSVEMRERAKRLAEDLRAEDGVSEAVRWIERLPAH